MSVLVNVGYFNHLALNLKANKPVVPVQELGVYSLLFEVQKRGGVCAGAALSP